MSQPPPDKVTLEDLLHLKRAERPSAEFWAQFDRELQAKQLAALIGKKPWWHSPARMVARFSYLPLGATAALAFALIAAHEYRSPVPEIANSAKLPSHAPQAAPAVLKAAVALLPQPRAEAVPEKTTSVAVSASRPAAPVVARQISTAISWLADQLQVTGSTLRSEPSFSASFADARIDNPRPVSDLASVSEGRVRFVSDPLTQVSPPSETQHARLLAALTDLRPAGAVDPVVLMHQRLSTRVDDEGLADDAGRLGASGNSVSFRF
jgi:hypothetical protein